MSLCRICKKIAKLLGGTANCGNDQCSVTAPREEIVAEIRGRRVGGSIDLSFSDLDESGRALCLIEVTLFQEEVNPFIVGLQEGRVLVTALHNHWLFDRPRLMYLHAEAIMNPLRLVEIVVKSLRFTRNSETYSSS